MDTEDAEAIVCEAMQFLDRCTQWVATNDRVAIVAELPRIGWAEFFEVCPKSDSAQFASIAGL